MQILIWGCGESCKSIFANQYLDIKNIIGFIDNNINLLEYMGEKIYRPSQIKEIINNIDYVIVTNSLVQDNKEIYKQAIESGIPDKKLLFINNYFKEYFTTIHEQNDEIFKKISPKLMEYIIKNRKSYNEFIMVNKCAYDKIDNELLLTNDEFKTSEYTRDYFRYRTFELMANEILEKNIEGNIAELGVFRGRFSKLINIKFPNRKLYLYDSFESFNIDEFQHEVENNNCEPYFFDIFKDTSVSNVMQIMKYPENIILRKGYFPESICKEDYNEKFAFVSLDVDFEVSTYEGLKFFYPRLVEGGCIFLHDYNNEFLGGVKKAVDNYMKDNNINLKMLPIADQGGTIVILK